MFGVYRKLEVVRIEMQLLGGKIARWEILDFIRHEGFFLKKSISVEMKSIC